MTNTLTTDINVLSNLVDEISVAGKDYDGTAIGMAIANATNRLRDSQSKSKIMILLSDGSNNSGEIDPTTASNLASEFGIKIYTIAAGTDNSVSRIPGRGLIRNEIDIETLKMISKETGGKFFRATDKEALSAIYDEISILERSEIEIKSFTTYYELYRWFLVPALILSFFYLFLKRYVTALFKKQWGANLSKFNGVAMLGGVTMNGEAIYSQAIEEQQRLEEQIQLAFELPVNYMIG